MAHTNNRSKQILFAHSAGTQSGPGEGSFDLVCALKAALPDGYDIHYPVIDDPEAPTYEMWRSLFNKEFKETAKPVILIGHSFGGSMLLKYLSEEKPGISVSGLFLAATPAWGEPGWEVDDFILQDDFGSTLRRIPRVYLYHCKQDDIVPFGHLGFYKKAFPNAIARELNGIDHAFADGLPELVSDIKAIEHAQAKNCI